MATTPDALFSRLTAPGPTDAADTLFKQEAAPPEVASAGADHRIAFTRAE